MASGKLTIPPNVRVGGRCKIGWRAFLDPKGTIRIGCDVTICQGVTILAHDASCARTGKKEPGYTEIGDGSFIGINSIVLAGVRIGPGAVIGAGSVVTKNIPANQVWAGNPARKLRDLPAYERQESD